MTNKDIYRIEIPKCDIQLEERFADNVEVTLWMTDEQVMRLARIDDDFIEHQIRLMDADEILDMLDGDDIEDYLKSNGSTIVADFWEDAINDVSTDEVLEYLQERMQRMNKYRQYSDDYKKILKTILRQMIKSLEK